MDSPKQLPVMLSPNLGPAVVIGGGAVALRKVRSLVEAGFAVRVIAPEIDPAFQGLAGVRQTLESFRPEHLDGAALVFACTNRREVNAEVGRKAREAGVPVLVADAAAESTFTSPAVAREDGLVLGVSTGGADPGRARDVKDRLAEAFASAAAARPSRRGSVRDG
jgi:siroheme synthase-like protein